MAYAKKKRTNVAIDPETERTIRRLANAMDTSFAKIAGQFLDQAAPQFALIAEAIENAKTDPINANAALHLAMVNSQQHALSAQTDFIQESMQQRKPEDKSEG